MKTTRRILSMVLVLSLLLSLGMSAMASGNSVTDLSFWIFSDVHKQFYQPGIDAWNQENPDRQVNVTFETYPNQELGSKLLIALQSGSGAPDIVDININYFSNFLQGDIQLAPLNRVVDPVKSQFVQSRFDIYSKNGTVYGLPTHVGATVVYYNKELTDKAGIDIDAIQTWADFEAAGKTYLEKTGNPFVGVETGNQRPFWPMILQRGGDYLNNEGNVALDSEVNIEVLSLLNKWFNEDKIAVGLPGGSTATEECFSFINGGGIAALIMPMWYMSRFINYMPDLKGKVYIRPMPVQNEGDARSAGIGGTGTAVTMQSKNVDLAVDLLAYLKLTPEANVRIWQFANFDPPRWDVWDRDELQQPDEYFGGEKVFNTLLALKDNIPSPNFGDLATAAQDIVMNTVMFQALEQKMDPAQVLKDAADELRAQ